MARYLGIEVTDSQVKGVVIRAAYRKLVIESVARVARDPGAAGLTAAVAAVVAQIGAPVDAAYAALPGREVSLRIIELPKAVARRGAKVIASELENSLPFDVEGAIVDAQAIRGNDPVELLAVAARTERVTAFVDALRDGGADPREVGVGPIALGELAREIPELAQPGPVLVVHAYDTHADFVVVAAGVVQMARTLGSQTTPAARTRGVRQTLSAYLAAGGTRPVAAYLCGDGGQTYYEALADGAEMPIESIQSAIPLGPIEVGPLVAPAEVQVCPLALAIALRGMGRASRIDLRKGALAVQGGSQVLRDRGWLLAGCAAGVLVSWGFATYARYASVANERDRLEQALGAVTREVFDQRVTDPARAKQLALGSGGETLEDPQPLADAFDVIGVLSQKIPDSIHHDITQLEINDEHVALQGAVDSLEQRDQIVEQLGTYECFQNIQQGRAQTAANRLQYTLEMELRCPERQPPTRGHGGAGGAHGTGTNGSGGSSGHGA